MSVHDCQRGSGVFDDLSSPEEVVKWLRAEPDRKKAVELAGKGVDKLAGAELKQWDSLRDLARTEKRRTLLLQQGSTTPGESSSSPVFKQPASPKPLQLTRSASKTTIPVKNRNRKTTPTSSVSKASSSTLPSKKGQANSEDEEDDDRDDDGAEQAFVVYSASVSPRK